MGGDGGSIPGRRDLVIEKRKEERFDRDVLVYMNWKLCALSQRKLQEPIVACELGRLYNKDAILQYLIDKSSGTISDEAEEAYENASHIRNLKDVKTLNLTRNPAFDPESLHQDLNAAEFICPISGLEMNGKSHFLFSWNCGCAFSERAAKEVGTKACPKCGKLASPSEFIQIHGPPELADSYQTAMLERREKAKLAKKNKKSSKNSAKEHCEKDQNVVACAEKSNSAKMAKKRPAENGPGKPETASAAGSSIQSNPNASKVFKSLFTSSEKGKKQERAHWVTYNPFYN